MPACAHRAGESPKSKPCRDGCADDLCSAAEKFNGASVTLNHPASNETLLTERSGGGGETKRWASRSRGVLGQASLSVNGSCPLAGSLAWGVGS